MSKASFSPEGKLAVAQQHPVRVAEAKTTLVAGLPFASKELIRGERKAGEVVVETRGEGLSGEALVRNEELQAQSKAALNDKDWNSLETLSKARLEIVPQSIMAQKLLAQAQYEKARFSITARRFNEGEKLLLDSLRFHLEFSGPKSDSVGRCMLELGRTALGNAQRKLAVERLSNAREILELNGMHRESAECDEELAKLK